MSKPVGLVTRTDPPAGETVEAGATITVYLSSGPGEVEVPDVSGMTKDEAVDALTALKLNIASIDPDDEHPEIEKDTATGTEPAAGEMVASGDSVVLLIASGEVDLPDVTGIYRGRGSHHAR